MAQKLKSTFSMKFKSLYILLPILLTSCSTSPELNDKVFCFDSLTEVKLYEGNKDDLSEIKSILNNLDKLTDNYQSRGINNVYTINQSNDDVEIDPSLYDLLTKSFNFNMTVSNYFNPLCGSLSKKWKESLKIPQILAENVKNEELLKINESSLLFADGYKVKRVGEAEIDLGAVAKGYAMDKVQEYLKSKDYKNYLVNGGTSSVLLGEKKTKDGLFTIRINKEIIPNSSLKLKNCFVSTSASYSQGVEIDDKTYSHIVNPVDGSAISKHDAVMVISDQGYFGDALSTAMMMCSVDEIKQLETTHNVKAIVFDNKQVTYCNDGVEVYH